MKVKLEKVQNMKYDSVDNSKYSIVVTYKDLEYTRVFDSYNQANEGFNMIHLELIKLYSQSDIS